MYSNQSIPPFRKEAVSQKKNKKLLRLLYIFFITLAIITILKSPISRITSIKITGIEILTEKEILDITEINYNMHYFFVMPSMIEKKLLGLEEVKNVKVSKHFPGKLIINIEENKPVAFLYKDKDAWIPVLENGYLINNKKIFINRPLITNWKNEDNIAKLAEQLTKIKPSILDKISEIQQSPTISDPLRLIIFMKDGYKIHILLSDLSDKLNLYPSIINSLEERKMGTGNLYLLDSIRFEEYKIKSSNNVEIGKNNP